MKVKDLRKLLKTLPPNMDVVVNSGISTCEVDDAGLDMNYYYGVSVRKAKTKLVRTYKGHDLIQSRPKKDDKAKLSLVLE